MMMFVVAGREFRSMFLSPLAWSILGVVQLLLAYMFLSQLEMFLQIQGQLAGVEGAPGVTQIVAAPVFGNAAIVLLLVVPMLTMRLVSEERRAQTMSLLFSAPLSMTEIVLGKYLGVLGFLLVLVGFIALMPLSLIAGVDLDLGLLAAGLLGLVLLVASFAAIGLYLSTLTNQPTVAAVSTFGVLLLLWVLDWAGDSDLGEADGLFTYVSMLRHFESLLNGVFNSSDVAYYLLFITTFLVLSIRRLDADRLPH